MEYDNLGRTILSGKLREKNVETFDAANVASEGKFMMTLKVFWLYMLVAWVMSILLIQVAYFIFVVIEVGLTLIKLLMILILFCCCRCCCCYCCLWFCCHNLTTRQNFTLFDVKVIITNTVFKQHIYIHRQRSLFFRGIAFQLVSQYIFLS